MAITVESQPHEIGLLDENNNNDNDNNNNSGTSWYNRYPSIQYSNKSKVIIGGATTCSIGSSSSCAICLADYNESDWIRVLPACDHFFHLKCVDPWLRINMSCPICRKKLLHIHSTIQV
ncbi:hypothetical protein S83_029401 [Arachis hypogaea]